jgi:succinate-semialdehyde dehydrogenase/glutarate-semialdehyde dehydrogenase
MTMVASVDEREAAVLAGVNPGLVLGGMNRPASDGATLDVIDPSTGSVIATIASASVPDARASVEAAVATQREWERVPARQRGEILRGAFELMVERADDLALLMTLEMGKPVAESRNEVLYAAEFLRWFAEEAVRIGGSWREAPDGASRILTMRSAVGPCLLVTPWNFPLAMGTRKIGPALAAGCTVIVKPAKQTPLSMLALAGILKEAGLPDGVLSVLPTAHSAEVVAAVLADPRVRKLSFTGSTVVGITLGRLAMQNVQRVSLELGGNAPFIVFADADLDHAVDQAVLAKLRNNGEACTAANRFYVHESVVDAFAERLVERFAAIVVGRGTEPGVTLGPLIDDAAVDKVAELVDAAVAGGAIVAYRGEVPAGRGSFSPPIVLTSVPSAARIVQEEIFGPVAPIVSFSTEDDVIALANESEYGLASYVFTESLDRALRVAERLAAGMVGLNRGVISNSAAPFGGIKASGIGREGGDEGIAEYLDLKYVSVDVR